MPALNFKNYIGQSEFTGTIHHQGFDYDYTIYITPLTNESESDDIINYFGNRTYKGKLCLDIDEEGIKESIDNDEVSAFFIVKVAGINNVASGSLQIYDWCKTRKGFDVWINDVCKISSDDVIAREKTTPGSTGAPVDIMFILMEQLVVQNLGKRNIKLFVENEPTNAKFLVPRYQKMGFQIDSICNKKFKDDIVMEKQINPDISMIDFSFLITRPQQIIGGRYKKKKTSKRKFKKNKTYRRKYKFG
jgi:hypothetical protein